MANTNDNSCFIIAEAGVNHNGNLQMAEALVEAAASAGASAVKFQSFIATDMVTAGASKAAYQIRGTPDKEGQLEMIQKLELSRQDHLHLLDVCTDHGIEFLSSPFDIPSLHMLAELGVKRIKIGSGEITNLPLLVEAGKVGLPVILSTGMSTLGEIEIALGALAHGYGGNSEPPGTTTFIKYLATTAGSESISSNVSLLHCTTEYPAPYEDTNLRAMQTLSQAFCLPVGFSDHTVGTAVAIAAVALGARVIEKHLTLDRTLPGPDHGASLEPTEFSSLVQGIHATELALGSSVKRPTPSELGNMSVARKSLVAARDIKAGEVFSEESIAIKRPGSALAPGRYWEMIGQIAKRDFANDEPLELEVRRHEQ